MKDEMPQMQLSSMIFLLKKLVFYLAIKEKVYTFAPLYVISAGKFVALYIAFQNLYNN
jgi:hypothetical protein